MIPQQDGQGEDQFYEFREQLGVDTKPQKISSRRKPLKDVVWETKGQGAKRGKLNFFEFFDKLFGAELKG